MTHSFRYFVIFSLALLLGACSDDDDNNEVLLGEFQNGFFVLNEGPFNSGSGSISFLNESHTSVTPNAYQMVNGGQIGNILQSGITHNVDLYLVVNNAHRLIVCDRFSLQEKARITEGLDNPRYMVIANGKGFVSNWGNGTNAYISVINLQTYTIENTISLDKGAEKMFVHEGKVYVLHQGGYDYNNKISVIDAQSESLLEEFSLGDIPNSFAQIGNTLYILCGGNPSWAPSETEASLYALDLSSNSANPVEIANFGGITNDIDHAEKLCTYNGVLYFANQGKIFKMFPDQDASQAELFLDTNFYEFQWLEGYFYIFDAGDYVSNGELRIYDEAAQQTNSLEMGLLPRAVIRN